MKISNFGRKQTNEEASLRMAIQSAINENQDLADILREKGTATNPEELRELYSAIVGKEAQPYTVKEASPQATIDPLQEPVVEKPYTKMNVNVSNPDEAILEPRYTAPPADNTPDPDIISDGDKQQPQKPGEIPKPPKDRGAIENPYLIENSKKDQKLAAEQLADMALGAYDMLHDLARKFLTVDENKLMRKAINGKFDMDVLELEMPINETGDRTVPIKDFISSYNQQIDDIYVVEDEWKEKVRPVLIRIFIKHGWGMTDEQYLLYMVVEDLTPKLASLFTLKVSMNQILNLGYEQLKAIKVASGQQPNINPIYNEPQKPQEQKPQEQETQKPERMVVETDPVITSVETIITTKEPEEEFAMQSF